jgi:hypothetical protein
LILVWFPDLDEHTAFTRPSQIAAACDEAVGTLYSLDTEDDPLLHHDRLTNIFTAQRDSNPQSALDIAPSARIGRMTSPGTFMCQDVTQDLMHTDDAEPLILQQANDSPQQPVIAEGSRAHTRQKPRSRKVGT